MFQKKDIESASMETVIGPGTRFEGKINSKGFVRVDGTVAGSILAEGVIIGEKAQIAGDIVGGVVFLAGQVTGNVTASTSLEIQPKGRLKGDVTAAQLSIAEGAFFEGTCAMSGEKLQTHEKGSHHPKNSSVAA